MTKAICENIFFFSFKCATFSFEYCKVVTKRQQDVASELIISRCYLEELKAILKWQVNENSLRHEIEEKETTFYCDFYFID